MSKSEQPKLFEVEIVLHNHGFVKVRARNKNEAKKAVEAMDKRRLLSFFKKRCEFLDIGEVQAATQE